MSDDMTTKYQQHYNQILSGTLTDSIMKNISYQANIKLANEIISEQEKTILDLQAQVETSKQELETVKNNKLNSDNIKINSLENTIKLHADTINRLNGELSLSNKLKNEFDNLKNQANNSDVFRKELVKERENHEATKQYYENTIKELNEQIELLKAPPKRKKTVKKPDVLELVGIVDDEIVDNTEEIVKDGGTF